MITPYRYRQMLMLPLSSMSTIDSYYSLALPYPSRSSPMMCSRQQRKMSVFLWFLFTFLMTMIGRQATSLNLGCIMFPIFSRNALLCISRVIYSLVMRPHLAMGLSLSRSSTLSWFFLITCFCALLIWSSLSWFWIYSIPF